MSIIEVTDNGFRIDVIHTLAPKFKWEIGYGRIATEDNPGIREEDEGERSHT
jgi:hypothetical protein